MNIIAITGVHGSGKSTKVAELEAHYTKLGKRVYVVKEVARSCPYELGTIEAQEWIWEQQTTQEKYAIKQEVDTVLLDRMILDNLMYYRYIIDYDHVAIENYCKTAVRWWDLLDEARAWMPTYDHVIRMPLNLDWLRSPDPIRPKSEAYARRIDVLFDRYVQEHVTE